MCIGVKHGDNSGLKSYSRNELYEIGNTIHNTKHKFEDETFSNIQILGIGKRRGKRSGKNLLVKKNIDVIWHFRNEQTTGYGINRNNLIDVKCDQSENKSGQLQVGLVNTRSVCNKVDLLSDTILNEKLDILTICETWLQSENEFLLDQIRPSDFTAINRNREGRRGGGVAVLCRSSLKPKQQDSPLYSSFEHIIVSTQ